jgi:hypothetical protein
MTYPYEPGWKEGDTSREAAESMSLRAITLRKQSYEITLTRPGHTADEIANLLDESLLAIRPRISELRRMGLIYNCGRGVNRSGKPAHQWAAWKLSLTPDELNDRLTFLRRPRRNITSARQARHCYVGYLNLLMDRIENGDENAVDELRDELKEMQFVLDQSWGWVR